jgi:hypothetical protein
MVAIDLIRIPAPFQLDTQMGSELSPVRGLSRT